MEITYTVRVHAIHPCAMQIRMMMRSRFIWMEHKMTEQICLRMRIGGQEGWYPIVAWGSTLV